MKEDEIGMAHKFHVIREDCAECFGGKAGRKEPLGRPRHGWNDNIKKVF